MAASNGIPQACFVTTGGYKVFAGSRSDAFFFDFDGIKNLLDTAASGTSPPHTSGTRQTDHQRRPGRVGPNPDAIN
jgi:hypothetical protein